MAVPWLNKRWIRCRLAGYFNATMCGRRKSTGTGKSCRSACALLVLRRSPGRALSCPRNNFCVACEYAGNQPAGGQ